MSDASPPINIIGEANRHLVSSIPTIMSAAMDLAESGHEVLEIHASAEYPLQCIRVADSPLCSGFKRVSTNPTEDGLFISRSRGQYPGIMIEWRHR